VVNENSEMLRLDQHFSSKTTAFMRFNYDRSADTQPLSAAATDLQQRCPRLSMARSSCCTSLIHAW